jgi:F-type H+-transporting ATPase subunit b
VSAISLPALFSLLASSEQGGHAATWLGLPIWIWQSANLAIFFFLLYWFVLRKITALFRAKQLEVEERFRVAQKQRHDAERVADEIRERMTKVEREMEVIRAQGRADGEVEKAALFERAEQEAARVRQEAEAQIARQTADAVKELRAVAADLTASTAREIVEKLIDDADRRRLLEEGVQKLSSGAVR